MEQSSLPSLMDAPYHRVRMDLSWDDDVVLSASPQIHPRRANSFFMSTPTNLDDDQQKQDIDDNGENEFEFSSPVSEWGVSPSSPRFTFTPTTSPLLSPSVGPWPSFKPPAPPPLFRPPVTKPCLPSIAHQDFENSDSAGTIEKSGPVNKEANTRHEKLRKVKQHRLMDLMSRSSQDKQPRSTGPRSWTGRQDSIYSTSPFPFNSANKAMNETAMGIMGIKASPSFLRPAPPIPKSSFLSPTRNTLSATSSPSQQKKTSIAYGQGFLGCLGCSSNFNPPVAELSVA